MTEHPSPALPPYPRSPELMSRQDTALLVIDVQARLVPLIRSSERMIWNIRRLIDAAQLLHLPVRATEQYPQGLGPIIEPLATRLKAPPPPQTTNPQSTNRQGTDPRPPAVETKTMFSCRECEKLWQEFVECGTPKILVSGMETHVCVQQTALDLISNGFRVFVATDAVGTRHAEDQEMAFRRMESAGATLTTTEAAIFEWCENSAAEEFKAISQLIREKPPE